MKYIFFTFFIAVVLLSCSRSATPNTVPAPQPRDCMARVVVLDDSLGKARNHACENIPLSETIRQYADALAKISYRDCPAAFTTAFKKHREAWLALLPVTDQYPDLRGEMHVLFKQLESSKHAEQFNPLVKTVWDTWAEVEAAMKE